MHKRQMQYAWADRDVINLNDTYFRAICVMQMRR